ncbi:MAG: polyribonucleotide nucleotidyltransferase [Deltaproteobacteria bacterium RBG_16_54_11]|nr:MAG: polyribonucleotide nucleotidyltransferase [Deltaproteobacteria bacterium RBG_16_54_11]
MYKKIEREWAGRTLAIEIDKVAKQADGAVLVHYGETVVLVTAVANREPKEGIDFFPLLANYVEMTYAAGRIPGGFFKREGRPTDREILSSRLIDRGIRPLFPKGFRNDTQVVATVLSSDRQNDPSILGIIGASTALQISDIPFEGPLAGVKVGRIDKAFIINPTTEELTRSDLDLIVSGNRQGVVMVEGGGSIVDEGVMLEAIFYGYEALKPILDLQDELKADCGKEKRPYTSLAEGGPLWEEVKGWVKPLLTAAFGISHKIERRDKIQEIYQEAAERFGGAEGESAPVVRKACEDADRELVRSPIFQEKKRMDGRGLADIRPISCEVGLLPRTHGSALFTRGETQVMAVTTFGTSEDEKKVESLLGEAFYKTFMLHYNFPPFSVGEVSFLRSPSRREVGHGFLAERALLPLLPSAEEFPYTIRLVSEVLESNGSSSMATVCGGCLSLMDAGVPIKAPVAGIAMGLMKGADQVAILTDIAGDEDHHGDMDFKVAGTAEGITALQMDVKIPGLSKEIMGQALRQAREARLAVLDVMTKTLEKPRAELSKHAPRIVTIQINPDRIRDVVGPLGKNIRSIIERTGCKIDIEDTGAIKIASSSPEAIEEAIALVKGCSQEAEIGEVYMGKVKKIMDFGAFVEIMPGVEGLVHISQLARERVAKVTDVLKVGDEIQVKVLEIDGNGKIRLSRRALLVEEGSGGSGGHERDKRRNAR